MEAHQSKREDSTQVVEIPWYDRKFFRYAIGTLLVLTILLVFYHLNTFLSPIFNFISTLFIPIVISFLFYYLLRPIVHFCEKFKIPRILTILFMYAIIAICIALLIIYVAPIFASQIASFITTSTKILGEIQKLVHPFFSHFFHVNVIEEIEHHFYGIAQNVASTISRNIGDILGYIARIAVILISIPFIVFYLLKDDRAFAAGLFSKATEEVGHEIRQILYNMDSTLSSYIMGLVLVSSTLGVLLFIGYSIIGLNYAFILALMALVLTTIPFLGPFLAITPALLVGISQGPWMVLKVAVVFVIIQQCESNIISPQIIGHRLHMHPVTIILLLLAAGSLYGLVGLILVTPFYALSKVLIENLYKIYLLHYARRK